MGFGCILIITKQDRKYTGTQKSRRYEQTKTNTNLTKLDRHGSAWRSPRWAHAQIVSPRVWFRDECCFKTSCHSATHSQMIASIWCQETTSITCLDRCHGKWARAQIIAAVHLHVAANIDYDWGGLLFAVLRSNSILHNHFLENYSLERLRCRQTLLQILQNLCKPSCFGTFVALRITTP